MSEEREATDWTTEIDSKYRLVILAAKRAKQLQKGAKPRVSSTMNKFTRVALDEVQHGLIRYEALVPKPESAE
jgi:DNA-directed RNA polymerase subunit omega